MAKSDRSLLCPNSALEAIAWRAPSSVKDLEELPELKSWFRREFGGEVVKVAADTAGGGKEPTKGSR